MTMTNAAEVHGAEDGVVPAFNEKDYVATLEETITRRTKQVEDLQAEVEKRGKLIQQLAQERADLRAVIHVLTRPAQ